MSEKVQFFKLWSQLNKENIFSQKDCFKCLECKYAKNYKEYTHAYKEMTQKYNLQFIKCNNNECEYWKVSYSNCPYFEKQVRL